MFALGHLLADNRASAAHTISQDADLFTRSASWVAPDYTPTIGSTPTPHRWTPASSTPR